MDERQQPARVWAPVGALAERQGVPPSVRHACIACADAVAAVGASLSLAYGDGPCEPVFASDPGTSELQGLQFRLGEGPGVDALSSGRTVLAVDLSSACSPRRWPGFAPAAVQRGVRAVFAFPVRGGPIRSGVLEMYRLLTGPLSRRQLAAALLCADVVLALDDPGWVASGPLPRTAWETAGSGPGAGWRPG